MKCCAKGDPNSKKLSDEIDSILEKAKRDQAHHVKLLLLGFFFYNKNLLEFFFF